LPEAFGAPAAGLKLAFLPNPNSPTGTMVSREAILKLAEGLPCPLLVDEAYVDFAEFNCVDLVAKNDKILVSRTLSKSYGLAGLRFGYLVGQPQVINELIKVKDSYNCDSLSIAAATAAINDEAWLAENRRKIVATRGRLVNGLQDLGFEVIPSQANFVWCNHGKQAPKTLYERLKSAQVLVRYMNYPGWSEGLRVSVGTDEQIEALLGLLKSMV
jgi:histidinol-phosphate aminotransferase